MVGPLCARPGSVRIIARREFWARVCGFVTGGTKAIWAPAKEANQQMPRSLPCTQGVYETTTRSSTVRCLMKLAPMLVCRHVRLELLTALGGLPDVPEEYMSENVS